MNFKHIVLSSLVVLSSALHAQDHIGWGNPGGPIGPGRDPWDDRRDDRRDERREDRYEDRRDYREREIEIQIRQNIQGQNQRLDLLRDSYIRSQLLGTRIIGLAVVASTAQGQGQARILANGLPTDSGVTVARYLSTYNLRVDPLADTLGRNLRTLELETRGNFYVEKALVRVIEDRGPSGPGPGNPQQPQIEVVRQQLNEQIQGEGGLQLSRVFNLQERTGQALRRVTILARSARGNAQAELLVNDRSIGLAQTIGISSTRLSFELNGQRLGQEIQSLKMRFRGNLVVEEATLEIERRGNPIPPFPPMPMERRIEQVINQRLYDTNGVSLTQLMRIDRRHEERVVDSVELVLRNSDYGVKVRLCQTIQDRFQTQNCGMQEMVMPGLQVIRLQSTNFAKLQELSLAVRMGMIDIERIIINLR